MQPEVYPNSVSKLVDTLNIKNATVVSYSAPKIASTAATTGTLGGGMLVSKGAILALSSIGFIALCAVVGVGLSLGVSTIPYGKECTQLRKCEPSENTICDYAVNTSTLICTCNQNLIWNNKQCVSKSLYNQTCTLTSDCRGDMNLECYNVSFVATPTNPFRCSCNDFRYWNGTQCLDKKIHAENCSTDYECNHFLNLRCLSLKCDCNSTQFWNGSNCETKRLYNETCLSSYWCNTAVNFLTCLNQTWSQETNAGTCRCTSSQYYDTISKQCKSVFNYGGSPCTSTLQCNTLVGLQCISGVCICNATSEYYDGTRCQSKVGINSGCQNTWISGFGWVPICNNLVGLSCTGSCACSSTHFWTNNRCTPKLLIGARCTGSSECDTFKGLSCISGFCQCSSTFYWNSATSTCTSKLSVNSFCTSDIQCLNTSGLMCSSTWSVCSCDRISRHYWSTYFGSCQYCPPSWRFFQLGTNYFGCYFISTNSRTYAQAQSDCTASTAHLLIVNDATEYNYFFNNRFTLFTSTWYHIGMQGWCNGGFSYYSPYIGFISGFTGFSWYYSVGCVYGAGYCCNYGCGCVDQSINYYGNPNYMVWHGHSLAYHNIAGWDSYLFTCEKL